MKGETDIVCVSGMGVNTILSILTNHNTSVKVPNEDDNISYTTTVTTITPEKDDNHYC